MTILDLRQALPATMMQLEDRGEPATITASAGPAAASASQAE